MYIYIYIYIFIYIYIYIYIYVDLLKTVLKTFPGPGYLCSKDRVV